MEKLELLKMYVEYEYSNFLEDLNEEYDKEKNLEQIREFANIDITDEPSQLVKNYMKWIFEKGMAEFTYDHMESHIEKKIDEADQALADYNIIAEDIVAEDV